MLVEEMSDDAANMEDRTDGCSEVLLRRWRCLLPASTGGCKIRSPHCVVWVR